MSVPLNELSRALSQTTINGEPVIPQLRTIKSKRDIEEPRLSKSDLAGGIDSSDGVEAPFEYPDGGYGWVVLGCCMTFAALTLGWGVSWGVFQSYYSTIYDTTPSTLSLVGGLHGLTMNVVSFVSGRISEKFGFKRMLYISAVATWLSLFLASWSTKLWQIMLTQGVMTGTAMGLGLPITFSLPSQWFFRRRGLASGLAVGGAGFGAGICTLLVRAMLVKLGARHTLLIYSFIHLSLMTTATFLIKTQPNSPEANKSGAGPWFDFRIWKIGSWYLLGTGLLVNTFGYSCVFYYIVTYVATVSTPKSAILAAVPLSIANFCAGIGRISVGYLADRIGPMNTLFLACSFASVAVFALWLSAHSFGVMMAFVVVYGLIAPTYLSLIPMSAIAVFGSENLASNVGACLMLTAPGALGGGASGGAILAKSGQWRWLIIFAGLMHAAAGVSIAISISKGVTMYGASNNDPFYRISALIGLSLICLCLVIWFAEP